MFQNMLHTTSLVEASSLAPAVTLAGASTDSAGTTAAVVAAIIAAAVVLAVVLVYAVLRRPPDRYRSLAVETIPLFTYADAIGYFVEQRPADERIKKGALLRQTVRRKGTRVVQIFLDAENRPVTSSKHNMYGRQVLAGKLDYELTDAFGKRDLILVE